MTACKPEYSKLTLHFCLLQMPCSKWRPFPCQNLCGNPLLCGNHYCAKSCHVLEAPLDQPEGDPLPYVSKESALAEPCEKCNLPCQRVCYSLSYKTTLLQFVLQSLTWRSYCISVCLLSLVQDIDSNVLFQVREPSCSHRCPLRCHLSDCPPCKVLVKKPCHCGAMVHAFECVYFNNLKAKEQVKVRSCGGPCHRSVAKSLIGFLLFLFWSWWTTLLLLHFNTNF